MTVRSVWRKLVNLGITKRTLKWTAVFFILKWVATFTIVAYLIRIEKWRHVYWLLFPLLAIILYFAFIRRKKKPIS